MNINVTAGWRAVDIKSMRDWNSLRSGAVLKTAFAAALLLLAARALRRREAGVEAVDVFDLSGRPIRRSRLTAAALPMCAWGSTSRRTGREA